jgi:hemerythrin HHE cation binding domain-containing protein
MTSEAQEARQHREEAEQLPDGDVVGIVLRHHADITDAMERIKSARGQNRVDGWEALKRFLKAHETAEQQVIRPVVETGDNPAEAEARMAEEAEADQAVARLSVIGADSPEFGPEFAQFAEKVHQHAEAEEHDELPLLKQLPAERRVDLGTQFLASFQSVAG